MSRIALILEVTVEKTGDYTNNSSVSQNQVVLEALERRLPSLKNQSVEALRGTGFWKAYQMSYAHCSMSVIAWLQQLRVCFAAGVGRCDVERISAAKISWAHPSGHSLFQQPQDRSAVLDKDP